MFSHLFMIFWALKFYVFLFKKKNEIYDRPDIKSWENTHTHTHTHFLGWKIYKDLKKILTAV